MKNRLGSRRETSLAVTLAASLASLLSCGPTASTVHGADYVEPPLLIVVDVDAVRPDPQSSSCLAGNQWYEDIAVTENGAVLATTAKVILRRQAGGPITTTPVGCHDILTDSGGTIWCVRAGQPNHYGEPYDFGIAYTRDQGESWRVGRTTALGRLTPVGDALRNVVGLGPSGSVEFVDWTGHAWRASVGDDERIQLTERAPRVVVAGTQGIIGGSDECVAVSAESELRLTCRNGSGAWRVLGGAIDGVVGGAARGPWWRVDDHYLALWSPARDGVWSAVPAFSDSTVGFVFFVGDDRACFSARNRQTHALTLECLNSSGVVVSKYAVQSVATAILARGSDVFAASSDGVVRYSGSGGEILVSPCPGIKSSSQHPDVGEIR